MKIIVAVALLFLAFANTGMCQVSVSEALISGSEPFRLNTFFVQSSGDVRKISIGPFKTIKIQQGKDHLVGQMPQPFLAVIKKNVGLKKSIVTTTARPYSMRILSDGNDTAVANIEMTTVKGERALIEMTSGNAVPENNKRFYCSNIEIQVKSDSLSWYMPQYDDDNADFSDYPLSFDRILTNGIDQILVEGAEDFPARKAFRNATRGIVFIRNKKQIAALETYPQTALWLTADIDAKSKTVIGAIAVTLLATQPALMR